MADRLSKTQIDKLGERLKSDRPGEQDLQALEAYRCSFIEAFDTVIREIREQLGLIPTGRPSKTIPSLRQKLRRESIRLTQIQDVAGCRLIVPHSMDQDRVVGQLRELFPDSRVVDRRTAPSHGDRAVHVVVMMGERPVEIQVRTVLQQRWAELSEK